MKEFVECQHCGRVFKFNGASNDELGWHTTCPECEESFDINVEDYLLPLDTIVSVTGIDFEGYEAPWYGVINGSDEDDCEEFEEINYYIVPQDRAVGDVWGNGIFMLPEFFEVWGD